MQQDSTKCAHKFGTVSDLQWRTVCTNGGFHTSRLPVAYEWPDTGGMCTWMHPFSIFWGISKLTIIFYYHIGAETTSKNRRVLLQKNPRAPRVGRGYGRGSNIRPVS